MLLSALRTTVLWSVGAMNVLRQYKKQAIVARGREALLCKLSARSLSHDWANRYASPAFKAGDQDEFSNLAPPFRGHFVVAGFPRSGNLWMTSLLSSVLGLPIAQSSKPHVTFTHMPHRSSEIWDYELLRGVIIVRDLRDVVPSYFRFSRQPDFIADMGDHGCDNIEDYYFQVFLPTMCIAPTHASPEHLFESYREVGWPYVLYEKLAEDPVGELRKLVSAWQLVGLAPDVVENAAAANTKERLKSDLADRLPRALSSHVNVEKHSALPARVLADIERRFGPYLRQFGYLD